SFHFHFHNINPQLVRPIYGTFRRAGKRDDDFRLRANLGGKLKTPSLAPYRGDPSRSILASHRHHYGRPDKVQRKPKRPTLAHVVRAGALLAEIATACDEGDHAASRCSERCLAAIIAAQASFHG